MRPIYLVGYVVSFFALCSGELPGLPSTKLKSLESRAGKDKNYQNGAISQVKAELVASKSTVQDKPHWYMQGKQSPGMNYFLTFIFHFSITRISKGALKVFQSFDDDVLDSFCLHDDSGYQGYINCNKLWC